MWRKIRQDENFQTHFATLWCSNKIWRDKLTTKYTCIVSFPQIEINYLVHVLLTEMTMLHQPLEQKVLILITRIK